MSSNVLQFSCTHCQTPLTVPSSMAGVVGPCPKCGETIQAPQVTPATAPASFAAEPREKPKTSGQAKIPEPREKPKTQEEFADRPMIPPAPRGLPERQAERKVAVRHSTSDAASRSEARPERRRSSSASSDSRPGLSRVAVPVLFAVVSAAVVYFLLYHFMPGGPGKTSREVVVNPPTAAPPSSDTMRGAGAALATPPTAPVTPTPSPRNGTATPRPTSPPRPAENAIPAGDIDAAKTVLMSFFGRKTLEERLAMAEPALPASPLKNGILDGTLPPVGEALSGSPEKNILEDYVDIPFNIEFPIPGDETGEMRDTMVIVRKRGDGEPKILVEPLLDLAGGALDAFIAEPVDEQQTFFAVIEAMPRCFEVGIPNADKKFTYKISSSTRQSEILRAYASRQSPLAEQLYSPDSGIGWGRRIRATIVLEWNTTEDPENPYIEMREIKALNWSS